MAAATHTVTVLVKSLAGDLLELTVDPREGEEGVIQALKAADPNAYGTAGRLQVFSMTPNGERGRIQNVTNGELLTVLVNDPTPHAILRERTLLPQGARLYRFDLNRATGMDIVRAAHLEEGESFTAEEIRRLVAEQPIQPVWVRVGANGRAEMVTEHPALHPRGAALPVLSRKAGQSDAAYFGDVHFYYAKLVPDRAGLRMRVSPGAGDLRLIRFRVRPEAVAEMMKQIGSAQGSQTP